MRRYELDTSYQGNMPNEVEFTLDNRYVVKKGDERFYNLMGETMLSAFNGLYQLHIYASLPEASICMVELVAQDIIVISNDFDMYYHRVRKYRAIINVIDEKIFEYDPVFSISQK